MKKCILGIGILLFAILFALSSSGMGVVSLTIGFVGLSLFYPGIFMENKYITKLTINL